VGLVEKPVGSVEGGEGGGINDEEILGVVELGLFREVEGAGDYEPAVQHHVFVVENGMGWVEEDGDVADGEERGLTPFLVALRGVKDHLDGGSS
jgi:hypothetical protein